MLINDHEAATAQILGLSNDLMPTRSSGRGFGEPRTDFGPAIPLVSDAVEAGLPRHALRHVAEWLSGGDAARVASLEWGIVPKATLERRGLKLSVAESERTERVARLIVHARSTFGSDAPARSFLLSPNDGLDGHTPFDMAETDQGTRRAGEILDALENGRLL